MPIDSYNEYGTVTPSDTVDLPKLTDAIWVGGTGAVAAVAQNGQVVLITAVPAGELLPIKAKRINATGTSATAIVALYQR